ncbi:MAG TPA: hypothetical protein VLE91_01880 [Candidatus Saccharimonadales bacterium]|nr:hypothetical protein [Candidatus Saccharimonadales bacterium]
MPKNLKLFPTLTFGVFGFIFFHLAKEMLQIRQDGWYVGQVNLYGDLVFHLGLINKYLVSNKILPESPIYAGSKPNYPIFADFITAQIAKITSVDWALFFVTFSVGLLSIFVARLFIKNFIKNEKVVFLSLLLFFINGGFGFIYFFQDYLKSNQNFFSFLFNMPRQYTDIKEIGYWWINNYLAYFLPQRAFLFAFPITLVSLLLLYRGVQNQKTKYFLLAGLLSGILPIVQAHSLFVLFLLSVPYAIGSVYLAGDKKTVIKNWLIYAAVTISLALPLIKSITTSGDLLGFIKYEPGFTSKENILWFWFKNLGLFAPTLLIAIAWIYKKNRHLFFLYLPFLGLFVLANIFIFQPWAFDNTKIMIYWYFVSCLLVGYFLYDQFFTETLPKKIFATIVVVVMTLSGALDLFRTFTPPTNYQIFSNADIEVATAVKNLTSKEALFTTASNHNNPIPALSGRSTLIGFHGWVWSHGLPFEQRAKDVEEIYMGGERASQLISQYNVNYVSIGPEEKKEFKINYNYFSQFPQIYLTNNWVLYDVNNLRSNINR